MTVVVASEIDFVNRNQELEYLAGLLPPKATQSCFVIIRSPPGYGKSRLTSELIGRYAAHLDTAVVDPLIRSKQGTARIYDGLFVQRCADELSKAAEKKGLEQNTFKNYLAGQRWRSVRRKNPFPALRDMPGLRLGYSLAIEYAERFFAKGRFGPRQLLSSDTREAVTTCSEYVEFVCRLNPTLLVIREAQYIDHESLRIFLQLNIGCANQHLILEYTTDDGRFDNDHEKLLQRELQGHPNAHLLDLVRLDRSHLDDLLRRIGAGQIALDSDFYGRWDGNLRVLTELKYRVSFGRHLTNANEISRAAPDLARQIREHIAELTASQKWLLAIAAAHIEPIHRRVLFSAALAQAPNATETSLSNDLRALVDEHKFLDVRNDQISLSHEDLAAAIQNAADFKGLLALSEKALREHYRVLIQNNDFTSVSMAYAARRLFALSVRTRDIALLLQLIDDIDEQIRGAHDQTIYIDIAVDAVSQATEFLPPERARFVDWAGYLAYELNDFRNTVRLFEQVSDRNPLESAILAFSYMEGGKHDEARAVGDSLRSCPEDDPFALVPDMIEAGIALDAGCLPECSALLERIITVGTPQRHPIVGHAYRLIAEIKEYPECVAAAVESVNWFKSAGLTKCAAYSGLSASRFLARTGRIEEAMAMIETAEGVLRQSVRNQHILLNNRALVGMLADAPDYKMCADWLRQALRTSRDDFSDLTILSNLAVAHWKRGAIGEALECVARCKPILDGPEFVERDIFWPVCFNLKQVLDAAGDHIAAAEIGARPHQTGQAARINDRYWAYRYGESATPDPALTYLLRFDYHPAALSHWQLDFEALVALRPEWRERRLDSSNPRS